MISVCVCSCVCVCVCVWEREREREREIVYKIPVADVSLHDGQTEKVKIAHNFGTNLLKPFFCATHFHQEMKLKYILKDKYYE